jgi:hypothetical protein
VNFWRRSSRFLSPSGLHVTLFGLLSLDSLSTEDQVALPKHSIEKAYQHRKSLSTRHRLGESSPEANVRPRSINLGEVPQAVMLHLVGQG